MARGGGGTVSRLLLGRRYVQVPEQILIAMGGARAAAFSPLASGYTACRWTDLWLLARWSGLAVMSVGWQSGSSVLLEAVSCVLFWLYVQPIGRERWRVGGRYVGGLGRSHSTSQQPTTQSHDSVGLSW